MSGIEVIEMEMKMLRRLSQIMTALAVSDEPVQEPKKKDSDKPLMSSDQVPWEKIQ